MMFIQYEEGSMPLNLANPTDVGYDLAPKEDTLIVPGRNLVHTGIHILLPAHCEAQVRPRSGCNLKGCQGDLQIHLLTKVRIGVTMPMCCSGR